MDSETMCKKPHAVFIPHPLQGHINPMMKLAHIFHQNGFYITFIIPEFIQKGLSEQVSTTGPRDFNFETYPDGFHVPDAVTTPDLFLLCESSRYKYSDSVRKIVMRVNDDAGKKKVPTINCVVADVLASFTTKIAQEIEVQSLLFWTASACSLLAYRHYRQVNERGPLPITRHHHDFKLGETSDDTVDWIPGLKNVRLRDLSFVDISHYDYPMVEIGQASKDVGLIINTFDTLEQDALSTLSSMFEQVYAIGPLHMLKYSNTNITSKSISFNFWEQEKQCLEWLDSKEPNSVVYISFGSLIFMTMGELVEFAWGIINTNRPFLWVIRSNMVNNEPTILPHDLLATAKERGLIVSWCPQEEVINHSAIGGFITHCGWNSTLDSICAGVPIICWPRIGDQVINCRYSCTNWGIGMEIDSHVKRDKVEELVRNLMDGEHGKMLRANVKQLQEVAINQVTSQSGSSSRYIEKLLKAASN